MENKNEKCTCNCKSSEVKDSACNCAEQEEQEVMSIATFNILRSTPLFDITSIRNGHLCAMWYKAHEDAIKIAEKAYEIYTKYTPLTSDQLMELVGTKIVYRWDGSAYLVLAADPNSNSIKIEDGEIPAINLLLDFCKPDRTALGNKEGLKVEDKTTKTKASAKATTKKAKASSTKSVKVKSTPRTDAKANANANVEAKADAKMAEDKK